MTSFSQTLEETLQRSIDYASQKKHEHVTIEHLLLSLTDDKDAQKVKLILNFPESKINEVPDPYYGGDHDFEHVYRLLDIACKYHSERLKNKL